MGDAISTAKRPIDNEESMKYEIPVKFKPLSDQKIKESLVGLIGWEWSEDKLKKSFHFSGFRQAMGFILRISYEAEAVDHHPEIFNCYNRVEIGLNTHDAGGKVTEKDINLARAIEEISEI